MKTRLLLLASALALVSAQAHAQAPAAGSIAVQVKNEGAGSTTVWLGPGSPPVLQGIAAGGTPSLFGLGSAISVNEGALVVSPAWSSITGTPTTLAGYGITDGLTAATAASTYVSLTGSYADPAWITALAWSKITGAPSFLTANQTITLSGDITGSGTTAITTTLADNAVTFAKLQDISTAHLIGRHSSGSGDAQQIGLDAGGLTMSGGNLVLTNTGVTAGSYTAANITVDAQGRVTASSSTIPLPANPADSGFLTNDGSGPAWTSYSPDVMAQASLVVYAGDITFGNNYTGLRLPSNNGVHAFFYAPNGLVETFAGTNEVPIQLPSVSGTLLTTAGNGGSLTNLDPYALQQRSASNGQVLTWSTANSRWQPSTGTLSGSNSGDVTLAGSLDYLTLSGQTITLGAVDLATDTTGSLAWASVSKSGSSLADLATRSAGDLNSGTLDAARLPAPTTTTLGGVQRNTGSGGQFVNGIDSAGALTYGTPAGAAVEIGLACSDETSDLTTGVAKVTFRMPHAMTLTAVRASVTTASTGSTIVVNIKEGGTTVLGTKLSIDASARTSTTATSQATITDAALADDAEITIDIDQVGSSTPGKGLKVWLIGTRN